MRPGFTLVEILVATALLGLALGPLMMMQSTALGRARTSRSDLLATALAAELADQLRLAPLDALPVVDPIEMRVGSGTPTAVVVGGLPLVIGAYPFDATVQIKAQLLDPPDLLARLVITVRWTDGPTVPSSEHRHVELVENRRSVAIDD